MFKPSKLRAYLITARDLGMSPEAILEGSGTGWREVETLEPMDLDRMVALFDLVARRTPPGFAMECGSLAKVRDFGIVGYSMMSTATLRDAFDHWNRYCLVAGHPLITSISEAGDAWQMHFVSRRLMTPPALHFCLEASITGLQAVIEDLTGHPPHTLRIDLPYARPADSQHCRLMRTEHVRFNAGHATYHGERSDLDRPIPARDADLRDILDRQCAKLLASVSRDRPVSEQLEDLMLGSTGRMPSVADMASHLGLSRRALQRALQEEGLSYQMLVERFRCRHAMTLLNEKLLDVKNIAFALGFHDAGSFRRAFHGWTGQSVGEWTQACRPAKPERRDATALAPSMALT